MAKNHENRLIEVRRFLQLDLINKPEIQDIVDIAAKLCKKQIAVISLLDDESNWVIVRTGIDLDLTPGVMAFCRSTIQQTTLLIVSDATKDLRFKDNPIVESDLNIRFYAGVPIVSRNGLVIGSLCLFDQKAGSLSKLQQEIMVLLGKQVFSLMELELSKLDLQKQIEEKEAKNESLFKIAHLQSHQIRQPLTSIIGLANLIKDGLQPVDENWLTLFCRATGNFDNIIREIVAETMGDKDLKAIRFNKMVEEIDDYAILLMNRHGYIENWNKGAEKIKGYEAKEIIGKHFSKFYTREDTANDRPAKLIAIAAEQGIARDEGWRVRKDGTLFWGSISITAIHDHKKNIIGFTKVTRDLTDITLTRESLMASEQLYKHLLEQTRKVARIGGWELDLIQKKVMWTATTREIHDVPADFDPVLETAINFYKKGNNRNKIKKAVKLAIEEGKSWDMELQLITAAGKEIWVRTTGNSNYKGGVCTRVYGTFQDIDEIKRNSLAVSEMPQHQDVLLCEKCSN